MRNKINAFADTLRRPLSSAVQRALQRLRQRKLGGEELVRELKRLHLKYGLSEGSSRQSASGADHGTPRIICSKALV